MRLDDNSQAMWTTIETYPFSQYEIEMLNAQALLSSLFSNWKPWLNLHMDQRPQNIFATCTLYITFIEASFWQSFNNERGFCVHQLDCQCLTLLSTNKIASTNLGIQLDIIVRFFFERKFRLFFWIFLLCTLFPFVSKSKTLYHLFGSLFYMLINFIYYLRFDFGFWHSQATDDKMKEEEEVE